MFEIEKVTGIGEYAKEPLKEDENKLGEVYRLPEGKAFLVLRLAPDESIKTVEVRTDGNLAKVLTEKYESVMASRYFGRRGVEIVFAGQLSKDEIYDLVRLSYNLTAE